MKFEEMTQKVQQALMEEFEYQVKRDRLLMKVNENRPDYAEITGRVNLARLAEYSLLACRAQLRLYIKRQKDATIEAQMERSDALGARDKAEVLFADLYGRMDKLCASYGLRSQTVKQNATTGVMDMEAQVLEQVRDEMRQELHYIAKKAGVRP